MAETPERPVRSCIVHSQGLFYLPSASPFLTYLSSAYEPGSQGIFIEEAFHCIVQVHARVGLGASV